jgi:hypothetical protein
MRGPSFSSQGWRLRGDILQRRYHADGTSRRRITARYQGPKHSGPKHLGPEQRKSHFNLKMSYSLHLFFNRELADEF